MSSSKKIPLGALVRGKTYRADKRNASRRISNLTFWRYRTRIKRKSGVIEVVTQ